MHVGNAPKFELPPANPVTACGEACVDEIAHLTPTEAGAALAYAANWCGVNFEMSGDDAAAIAFYEALERGAREARERLLGHIAKAGAP